MAEETKPAAKPVAAAPAPTASQAAAAVARANESDELKALKAENAALRAKLAASQAPSSPVDPASDGPGMYRVSWNGKEWSGHARDSAEAWALFSDSIKAWPGPKVKDRVIERIAA